MAQERKTTTSKTGGRPKKADGNARTELFNFRTTLAERAEIERAARQAGLSPSEYVRSLALGNKPRASRPATDPALISELNRLVMEAKRIGNNVNQLARATHRDSTFQQWWREIGQEVRTITGQLQALLERSAS